MRRTLMLLVVGLAACATSPHAEHVAPPATAGEPAGGEAVGSGGGGPEHAPEIVRSGRTFNVSWADAQARYAKGARCGGGDAPDAVIGKPDQHNEMQVAHDKVVTWGFRFPEGTLLIRCRADHVEVTRTLK